MPPLKIFQLPYLHYKSLDEVICLEIQRLVRQSKGTMRDNLNFHKYRDINEELPLHTWISFFS